MQWDRCSKTQAYLFWGLALLKKCVFRSGWVLWVVVYMTVVLFIFHFLFSFYHISFYKNNRIMGSLIHARRSNQSTLKEINPEYSLEDWCPSGSSNTLPTSCEELTHWKRPWCWEKLKARGEGHDRGWDGRMASPIQWIWVWAYSAVFFLISLVIHVYSGNEK